MVRQGIGKVRFRDDSWYEGDWYDNKPHGTGIYKNTLTHTKYSGTFRHGLRHGKGKERQKDGTLIEAVWQDDCLHGEAQILHLSGKVEMAKFIHGERIRFEKRISGGQRVDWDCYLNMFLSGVSLSAGVASLFVSDESTRRSLRMVAACFYSF